MGVAIEDDNMTETEFKDYMLDLHSQLQKLNAEAGDLEALIDNNIKEVF